MNQRLQEDAASDIRVAQSVQGISAIVYLLSTAGSVIPSMDLARFRPFNGLLGSGNIAIAVFLTAFGFTLTAQLLADRGASWRHLVIVWAKAVLPAVVAMALVTLAVLAVTRYDETDQASDESTRSSLLNAWTFRQNQWVLDHILLVRLDVSSLWIISLLVQYTVALLVAVVLLRRARWVLAAVGVTVAIAAVVWRSHVLASEGWVNAALDSFGRADGFALGVAMACVIRSRRLDPDRASELLGGASMVLATGVLVTPFVGLTILFDGLLPLAAALTALTIWAGSGSPDARGLATETLQRSAVVDTWRLALPLLVWAPFMAATFSRRQENFPAPVLALGAGVAAIVVSAATWWVLARGPQWFVKQWVERDNRHADDGADNRVE